MDNLTPEDRARLKERPSCCSVEDWNAWRKAFGHSKPNSIDWHCADCTPEFKARMMAAGKCDWPCVEFFLMPIIDNGRIIGNSIEGRRTSIDVHRGYAEGRKIIRIVDARKGVYDLEPEKPKT